MKALAEPATQAQKIWTEKHWTLADGERCLIYERKDSNVEDG